MVASYGGFHALHERFSYSDKTQWVGGMFSFLARYSFTVYLVHMPVIELTEYFSEHVHYLGYFPFLLIVLSVTALMTALLHHAVEVPFAKLIKGRKICQNSCCNDLPQQKRKDHRMSCKAA